MFQAKSPSRPTGASLEAAIGLFLCYFFVLAVPAAAGPPLICHPFDIADARSLPWGDGSGWYSPANDYEVQRLPGDTLALLTLETPVLVRMETLRRATVYAGRSPEAAFELLSRLLARALAGEAQGRSDPLAWFDAGYLVESYKQMAHLHGRGRVKALERPRLHTFDGYAWIVKALDQAGEAALPAMHFAAALVDHRRPDDHLRRAWRHTQTGSMLERNLLSHFPNRGK